jgi:hypothetical protein
MKKLLLVLVAVLGLSFAANAQNIGGRFGGGKGYGAELSYQHYLGSNRLELDLGFSHNTDNYINLAAAYHWVFPIAGDFHWFIGPCVNTGHCRNHGFGLAAGVQGGAEWDPQNVPIQLSLDGRPLYDFLMDPACAYNGFGYGVAFSVRYRIH